MTWILIILCNASVCGESNLQVGAYTSSMQECVAYGEATYERLGYAWLCSRVDPDQAIDTRLIVESFYADD